MPQRRNYPFYQIDLMCALALAIDLFDADCYEYKGLEFSPELETGKIGFNAVKTGNLSQFGLY